MEERKNSTKRFIIECCLFIIGLTIFEILVTKTFVNNYAKELTNAKLAILIIAATLGAIVYTVTVLLGWRCVLCLKKKKYKEKGGMLGIAVDGNHTFCYTFHK